MHRMFEGAAVFAVIAMFAIAAGILFWFLAEIIRAMPKSKKDWFLKKIGLYDVFSEAAEEERREAREARKAREEAEKKQKR